MKVKRIFKLVIFTVISFFALPAIPVYLAIKEEEYSSIFLAFYVSGVFFVVYFMVNVLSHFSLSLELFNRWEQCNSFDEFIHYKTSDFQDKEVLKVEIDE